MLSQVCNYGNCHLNIRYNFERLCKSIVFIPKISEFVTFSQQTFTDLKFPFTSRFSNFSCSFQGCQRFAISANIFLVINNPNFFKQIFQE